MNDPQHIDLEKLRRYVEGNLPEDEQQFISRLISQEPLYADAVEGILEIEDWKHTQKRLDYLKKKGKRRVNVLSLEPPIRNPRTSRRQGINISWYAGSVAAGIILILTTIFALRNTQELQLPENQPSISQTETSSHANKSLVEGDEELLADAKSVKEDEVKTDLFSQQKPPESRERKQVINQKLLPPAIVDSQVSVDESRQLQKPTGPVEEERKEIDLSENELLEAPGTEKSEDEFSPDLADEIQTQTSLPSVRDQSSDISGSQFLIQKDSAQTSGIEIDPYAGASVNELKIEENRETIQLERKKSRSNSKKRKAISEASMPLEPQTEYDEAIILPSKSIEYLKERSKHPEIATARQAKWELANLYLNSGKIKKGKRLLKKLSTQEGVYQNEAQMLLKEID